MKPPKQFVSPIGGVASTRTTDYTNAAQQRILALHFNEELARVVLENERLRAENEELHRELSWAEVTGDAVGLTQSDQQERTRREQIRWVSLQHLDEVRPQQVTDAALLPLIQAVYPTATGRELQRELDYLMACGLVTIGDEYGIWRLKLTKEGIDIVQYTTPCPQGIGRPALPRMN